MSDFWGRKINNPLVYIMNCKNRYNMNDSCIYKYMDVAKLFLVNVLNMEITNLLHYIMYPYII